MRKFNARASVTMIVLPKSIIPGLGDLRQNRLTVTIRPLWGPQRGFCSRRGVKRSPELSLTSVGGWHDVAWTTPIATPPATRRGQLRHSTSLSVSPVAEVFISEIDKISPRQ